jgi:hypothetical protein
MADFKDPLWPEPPVDIWQGGRPLAPPRRRLPPQFELPEIGTPEQKHYIIDPENNPVVPPKGDIQKGQPVGPATAKLPRPYQRQVVDQAHKDWMQGVPKQVDPETLARLSAMGQGIYNALEGQPEVREKVKMSQVANPKHGVFQNLLRSVPNWAPVLQRMKHITAYTDQPARAFRRGLEGVTTGIKPENMDDLRRFVATGRSYTKGPIVRSSEEMALLHELNKLQPGSTVQTLHPKLTGKDAAITGAHEGWHSIYARKYPGSHGPEIPDARARELMTRVLERSGVDENTLVDILGQYSKDPQHGLVEALAQWVYKKHGMGVR